MTYQARVRHRITALLGPLLLFSLLCQGTLWARQPTERLASLRALVSRHTAGDDGGDNRVVGGSLRSRLTLLGTLFKRKRPPAAAPTPTTRGRFNYVKTKTCETIPRADPGTRDLKRTTTTETWNEHPVAARSRVVSPISKHLRFGA